VSGFGGASKSRECIISYVVIHTYRTLYPLGVNNVPIIDANLVREPAEQKILLCIIATEMNYGTCYFPGKNILPRAQAAQQNN
jgi:hypothetical protein